MIVYLSDPENSTRELLNLIKNLRKVAGYKINSNKSVRLLICDLPILKDKQAEKEIRETSPFTSHKQYKVSWCDSNQTSERSV